MIIASAKYENEDQVSQKILDLGLIWKIQVNFDWKVEKVVELGYD